MHFAIQYLTEYSYDGEVVDNLNALRARPATTKTQRCDDFHVKVDPAVRLHRYIDYFGTEVVEFGIDKPHDHLSIDVRATVTTHDAAEPPEADWNALSSDGYRAAAGEYLMLVGHEPAESSYNKLAADCRATTPLASLHVLSSLMKDVFIYDPDATYVGSTIQEFVDGKRGVCQDFAHLATVILRHNGIAARYVSGYFWAADPNGGDLSLEVSTHAWVEALVPAGSLSEDPVWVAIDPTNGISAGKTHVKIGHGRSYADVPPIRGVYRGLAMAEPQAKVHMTRLHSNPSPRA